MKAMIGREGNSFPLGATLVPGGANFSVYAKHSTAAQLLLFDDLDALRPSRVIDLDPRTNRTCHHWHFLCTRPSSSKSRYSTRRTNRGDGVSIPISTRQTIFAAGQVPEPCRAQRAALSRVP
jgi:pullulanase/glycogen debranching enzyme